MHLRLPVLVALASISIAPAAVKSVQVDERTDVEQGRNFGTSGPYERITGAVQFTVDPELPANRLVHDLKLAPRDEQHHVAFSADFYVLKPRDPAKSNGTLLFEVSNRGGKGLIQSFDFGPGGRNPGVVSGDLGDAYLLEQGYTLVWLGWQADAPAETGVLRLRTPIARNSDGSSIQGTVRSDFVLDFPAMSASLGDMGHTPYLAADLHDLTATLTVREHPEDPRRPIPRDKWQFARDDHGKPIPDAGSVYREGGLSEGKIYEVLYTAKDPLVTGLGPAAVRDFVSFLKFGGADTLLSDQHIYLKRALGFGISQSGRFLRDFLYEGFNADEQGRRVFDGVWAHVGGAGRGNFNFRFAQPSRDARPFLNFFYPVDIFPFTDMPEKDSMTGVKAGLLDRAAQQQVIPKIFYTHGSYEYWGRAAALIHSGTEGQNDIAPSPDTRIYFIAGAQHGPGHLPPAKASTANDADPEDYRYVLRALLQDFQSWLKDGEEPPASRYPLLAKGELTTVSGLRFPGLPGVRPPTTYHKAYRVDYGPEFVPQGIVSEPPRVGAAFATLVPQVDADGNDLGGIRLPEIQVPLGTYTGWNFRAPQIKAPEEMASFIGSYFRFSRTAAERAANHDPRPSIAERYPGPKVYLERVQSAAKALVDQRLVLDRDIPAIVERARQEWAIATR